MLCVCDHFEPFHDAAKPEALERVTLWRRDFPKLVEGFRDYDGVAPRHTFFYPVEQHDEDVVGRLADLCHETGNEAEIHLHHDGDTADHLHETLLAAKATLAKVGLLSRDEEGAIRYGFIHGNWALGNSHPEGRHCGVSNELAVLRQTGCFADFTLPSAPSRMQTRTINSLYYAKSSDQPKSHDSGKRVFATREPPKRPDSELLMVQGPLALNWRRRKWGFLPRIENSDLTGVNPPTKERLRIWLECHIAVEGRPNWLFIKLHTHGAKPENSRMLLGAPMRNFHASLQKIAASDPTFRFHYVSARELVNILHAAEAGHSGDPGEFRNFRYRRIGVDSGL
jgi:hypothetical protein